MQKLLEGIRVLEWGAFHAGPAAAAILCDLGAEVIKIEQPGIGDPSRPHYKYKGIDFSFGKDRNTFYEGANRGKKGITVNLAHEKGRQIVYDLIETSDVFLTNIRPAVVKKMKMDYPTLSRINSRLIYASVTSYGTQGPDAKMGGFDYQGQGKSGFMNIIGEPGMPPLLAQFGIIDQATAIMASYQVVIALFYRERYGVGQEMDISLLGAAAYLMYMNNLAALITGKEVPRHEQASADPLRNYYQCKDGKWIVQTQPGGRNRWKTVCDVLDLPELASDPCYDTREKRLESSRELVAIFKQAFLKRPRDEWLRLFSEKDLTISPVNTTMESINDPQMIENGYIVDFDHPEIGRIRIPGFPMRFSKTPVNNELLAPTLGEHTDSVLREILKYGDEEIAFLKKNNVI